MVVVVAAAVCRRTEGEGCAGLESLDVTGRTLCRRFFCGFTMRGRRVVVMWCQIAKGALKDETRIYSSHAISHTTAWTIAHGGDLDFRLPMRIAYKPKRFRCFTCSSDITYHSHASTLIRADVKRTVGIEICQKPIPNWEISICAGKSATKEVRDERINQVPPSIKPVDNSP